MKNYVQRGDVIEVTAAAAVSSGDFYAVGQIGGVAQTDAAIGEKVQLAVVGVFDLTKVSTEVWAVGDAIYWDDLGSQMTNVANGLQVGVATAAAANPSTTGEVRLGFLFQPTYASY